MFPELFSESRIAHGDVDAAAVRKEVRLLKKVVASMEADMLSEKSKYQRALQKKQKQIELLTAGLYCC